MIENGPLRARSQLAGLSVAMILGMTPWFSATAAAPGMIAEWGMTATDVTWLTIAVQLGFVGGTFASAVLLGPVFMNKKKQVRNTKIQAYGNGM